MREKFLEQLERLNQQLIHMGNMVEEAIKNAITALLEGDVELANEVAASDDSIDEMEKEIESICYHLLLQQQPMATDLRIVTAALKIATDLERIGDHAEDISEMVPFITSQGRLIHEFKLKEMSETTISMVHKSIDAYVTKNIELAIEVSNMDSIVDKAFLDIKKEIASSLNHNSDSSMEELDLFLISKYFERIGDHAENVGEWVVFSLTGKHKDERVI